MHPFITLMRIRKHVIHHDSNHYLKKLRHILVHHVALSMKLVIHLLFDCACLAIILVHPSNPRDCSKYVLHIRIENDTERDSTYICCSNMMHWSHDVCILGHGSDLRIGNHPKNDAKLCWQGNRRVSVAPPAQQCHNVLYCSCLTMPQHSLYPTEASWHHYYPKAACWHQHTTNLMLP